MDEIKQETYVSYLEHKGKYTGIRSWIFTLDHKRIGLLYMYAIMVLFFVGAIMGLLMRIELIKPVSGMEIRCSDGQNQTPADSFR